MTIEEFLELELYPRMIGQPMYLGGAPVPAHSVRFENFNISQWWVKSVEEKIDQMAEQMVKQYMIYYAFAPIFEVPHNEPLKARLSMDMSISEIYKLLLEYGLDPI